jgi:hypothetical protein
MTPPVAGKKKLPIQQFSRAAVAEPQSSLVPALVRVLNSGASYNVKELRRLISSEPDADPAAIAAALEQLRLAGQVMRIPEGESWRYRKLAKSAPRAAASA